MDREATLRAARALTALPPGPVVTVRDALAYQLTRIAELADLAKRIGVSLDDGGRELLAREHYFRTWDNAMAHGDRVIDRRFEAAADAIVDGDLAALQALLDRDLALAASAYGHRQTLLQHVAANGIEMTRQWQSPANAPDIARALLAAGADPNATCESYAPDNTALTLLCSSAHPAIAGVQAALVEVLCAGGAKVDGIANEQAPLWTAIVWGYQDAVDALVRCGARIDDVVLAAATGDLALTKRFIAAPRVRHELPIAGYGKSLPAEHMLEYALIYAAGLDRREVVAYLLTLEPDLSIEEPIWGATARSAAEHPHEAAGRPSGNPEIIALLDAARRVEIPPPIH